MIPTIEIEENRIHLLDQRALPAEIRFLTYRSAADIADAIRSMVVRGAPAIGVTAAAGVAVEAARARDAGENLDDAITAGVSALARSRPTAVNLFWALDRMKRRVEETRGRPPQERVSILLDEARRIHGEDVAACHALGRHGAALLPTPARVLTHCNAGALATAGYGTALGVIRAAHAEGRIERVFADETRPFLQGARLTMWELLQDGIEATLITDSMAGFMMAQGEVNAVVVGADRIAANGDVVNKIGTYSLAVLAREHGLPFIVAAPTSTFDLSIAVGSMAPIEERSEDEVTHAGGSRVAPVGARVRNPAFDLTPQRLVTAIVCEAGVARAPFAPALRELAASALVVPRAPSA